MYIKKCYVIFYKAVGQITKKGHDPKTMPFHILTPDSELKTPDLVTVIFRFKRPVNCHADVISLVLV